MTTVIRSSIILELQKVLLLATLAPSQFETTLGTSIYSNFIDFFWSNGLVDFVVLPPGHGSSVTDFWGWDVHDAQLRCPDDVSGDLGGCSARRALKPKFY